MTNITLDRLLEEVKTLSSDEQRQLRDTLDAWLRDEQPEDRLERRLYEEGLLSEIKPPIPSSASTKRLKPVDVRGIPVSETIIEERR